MMKKINWEGRTWQFARDLYISITKEGISPSTYFSTYGFKCEEQRQRASYAITEAKIFIEEYRKSMEGEE